MDALLIEGQRPLAGTVTVAAAKNSILPLMAATCLLNASVTLENIPSLSDVLTMKSVLEGLGGTILWEEAQELGVGGHRNLFLDLSKIENFSACYDLVRTMRASILILGPLVAKYGVAEVSLPGGCAIGTRPIDIHLQGLKKMGMEYSVEAGYVKAKVNKALLGTHFVLPFPSVGATENLLMAASLAIGETCLENVALEPEIDDLVHFLQQQGVKIEYGPRTLLIQGKGPYGLDVSCSRFRPIGDRIEAATFLIAGLIAGKARIEIKGINPFHLGPVLETLTSLGAKIEQKNKENSLVLFSSNLSGGLKIKTAPYPGIPTDIQAQLMALALFLPKPSTITESIFENRFMHVPELRRLGAQIELEGNTAIISPQEKDKNLTGATVMCTDLRASACLVLAGLGAIGETRVRRIYHLDRGYDFLEKKLQHLGASISRYQE